MNINYEYCGCNIRLCYIREEDGRLYYIAAIALTCIMIRKPQKFCHMNYVRLLLIVNVKRVVSECRVILFNLSSTN